APQISVNPWLIAGMTASIVAFFLFIVTKGLATRRLPVVMGNTRGLIGAKGVASTSLSPEGTVLLKSEDWTAVAVEGNFSAGEAVEVVGVEGLKLRVRRAAG
ncbi:MAG: NfeD family protein, partial [Chloroflexi bacterium]|nr:NfeD family protein [Chloroflexota bacterium]